MDEEQQVTLEQFREVLTPVNVRTTQIINVALGIGVMSFFLVIVYFYFRLQGSGGESPGDDSLLQVLSMVHIAFAVIAFTAGMILYGVVINLFRKSPLAGTAEGCLRIIRMATIVRLALMEGAAFFGLVVCLFGAVEGLLEEFPVYWLNALSSLAMVAFIVVTFPTRDGLEQTFQNLILGRDGSRFTSLAG
jgi:hypothetical protein